MFSAVTDYGITGRAVREGLLTFNSWNPRDWTHDRHRTVDDRPFGGGPGMILKCEPVFEAVESLRQSETRVVLMCPTGRRFDQQAARELSAHSHLLILCPSYEGIDERIRTLVHDEFSVGDFVLTSGNLAAMMVIDAVTRLLPGALGDEESAADESFSRGLLEYPHYTR